MSNGTETQSTESSDTLGKDAFLQLLVTQLKYQDPMNPMDNEQFVAQMAQFSSLEAQQNLNATMEDFAENSGRFQVLNLLGTEITAERVVGEDENATVEEITGIVSKVDLSGSEPKLITYEGDTVLLSELKGSSIPTSS
jgi:flagellar basal-body rod modification protein FlgD